MKQAHNFSKVEEIIQGYGKEEASLIPVLQEVQGLFGYLSKEAMIEISKGLNVPLSRIYGVVTFYAQFYLNPRGRHVIKSCQGTACHVRGGKVSLEALMRELKVEPGGTTEVLFKMCGEGIHAPL